MKYVKSYSLYESEQNDSINEAATMAVKVIYKVLGNNYETIIRKAKSVDDAVKLVGDIIVGNWQLVSADEIKESEIFEGNKKFNGKTVADLLKVAGKKLGGDSFLVQDADGHDWAVFPDQDTQNGDTEIYGMDQYDNEKQVKISDIVMVYEGNLYILDESVNEAKTSEFEPPKFLVLPAVDPETQEPNDKLDAFMRAELEKGRSYYKPGIRSANPPENVDHTLEDDK